MNCYNGESYLDKAIESVFAQSHELWEIIFIDNCSNDNSAKIAQSYGERVKYFKTNTNLNLGSARKFGVEKCSKYIAVLDTDDIWLPNCLEVLYNAIKSGNYALAYGNQFQIDNKGERIGFIKNIYSGNKGNFFNKLLLQFDIPLVASLIDKEKMLSANLNFDENIYGSEEYCLFVQMAVKLDFIAVHDFLVNYRVHNSLSTKLHDKIHKERKYTLNKIIEENPNIRSLYPKPFSEAFSRGCYYEVQYLAYKKKKHQALKIMSTIMLKDIRYFFLTIILLFPGFLFWNFIQHKKYKR